VKAGSAYIEEHPKGSGKHRVRARAEGKLITIAKGLARSDAEQTRDAYALLRHEADLREGVTLEQFGIAALGNSCSPQQAEVVGHVIRLLIEAEGRRVA